MAHRFVKVSNLLQSAYTTGQTHHMHLSYATVCLSHTQCVMKANSNICHRICS